MIMGNPYLRGAESVNLKTSILNISVEACSSATTLAQNSTNATIYNDTNSNFTPSSSVASTISSSTVATTATGYNVNISNITASSNITSNISSSIVGRRRRRRNADSPAADSTIYIDITTARNWGQLINGTTSDEFGMITHCYVVDNATHPFLLRVKPDMARYNGTNATLLVYVQVNYEPTPLSYNFTIPEDQDYYLPPPSTSSNITQYCIGVQSAQGNIAF